MPLCPAGSFWNTLSVLSEAEMFRTPHLLSGIRESVPGTSSLETERHTNVRRYNDRRGGPDLFRLAYKRSSGVGKSLFFLREES